MVQFESTQIEALEFGSERASALEVSSEREEWQIWATVLPIIHLHVYVHVHCV